jgi:hypothetical protein
MNTRSIGLTLALLCASVTVASAEEYAGLNYPTRRALIADSCPHLKITAFSWGNGRDSRTYSDRFETKYAWENTGQKDILAFELCVLKYDPFNHSGIGSRCIFPGHNSAKYEPLKPGEKDDDGGSNYGSEETFTAICYVRSIRFADGTVWTVEPAALVGEIKKIAPDILNVGPLEPPKKKGEKTNE